MRGFLASMYVGLQIESNWTRKWVWALYLVVYPVGSFLSVLILYGVFGKQSGLLPFALYGSVFYYSISMVAFDTAMSVHDDREHYQTLKYIFLSSTSYGTYLCGRAATRYLIALTGIVANLCWMVPVLHLPFAPDWAALFLGCVLGYLIGAGLGMVMASLFLLTARLDTDVVEALFGGMFVMSGALFPPTAFPPLLERIAETIPVSGFVELVRRGISGVQFTGFLASVPLESLILRAALGAGAVFVLGVVLVGLGSRQAQRKGYVDMTTAF